MDENPIKTPSTHQVGMVLDTLSVSELEERIEQLQAEIERVKAAIAARDNTRKAAEAAFRL